MCSLVAVDRRFRSAYYLHQQGLTSCDFFPQLTTCDGKLQNPRQVTGSRWNMPTEVSSRERFVVVKKVMECTSTLNVNFKM
jgi:hypothetical protein